MIADGESVVKKSVLVAIRQSDIACRSLIVTVSYQWRATKTADTRQENLVANALEPATLDQLFRTARTFNEWSETPIDERVVRELYDLLKWGPTSANSCPARFVWVRSPEGKSQLASLAMDKNRPKIVAAPLTVIIGNDLDFPDTLPRLFPARGEMMRQAFRQPGLNEVTAMRNGTLQGAYLIIAARALGLDCGPMSGFDNAAVDKAFFVGTRIQSNFICSLGYGKPNSAFPRNPRLNFEEAARFA
jgi:3-hydroxypropanoate dehydrogenase